MSQNSQNGQSQGLVNVENLRKAGYKVRVCHTRDFWPLVDETDESIMTRREYESLVEQGRIRPLVVEMYDENEVVSFKYGDAVRPTGGFTLVEVTTPDGETLKGKFNFNMNRQYDKREGVKVALLRAFKGNLPNLS